MFILHIDSHTISFLMCVFAPGISIQFHFSIVMYYSYKSLLTFSYIHHKFLFNFNLHILIKAQSIKAQ